MSVNPQTRRRIAPTGLTAMDEAPAGEVVAEYIAPRLHIARARQWGNRSFQAGGCRSENLPGL